MPLTSLWEVLGGLGLFLLGMKVMSEGLQKLGGERFRLLLERITGNRLTAAFLGSLLASLLQSSSAAAILVIGFINAGLVSLYQALAILLGTGIGATLAIQFIAFKISSLALPAIFFGVFLKYFVRRRRWANLGELLLGAGLVFLGLAIMEAGFIPIRQTTLFQGLHNNLFSFRINAVLLGALLTFLVQSSSAAAGIVIAVTGSGLFSFEDGVAMIIGEVLGTAMIAVIASINGSGAAKRTAFVYLLISAAAIVLVLIFFPYFLALVILFTPGATGIGLHQAAASPALFRGLANAHTLFSLMSAVVFLPLIGFFARSAAVLLPGREGEGDSEPRAKFIDLRVINTPTIALLQARKELRRMAAIVRTMYGYVVEQLYEYDAVKATRIHHQETVLDILQRDISAFLVLLSRQPQNSANAMELPVLIHVVNHLEHLGDQCEAILDLLQRKKEGNVHFTETAMTELKELAGTAAELVELALGSEDVASDEEFRRGRAIKDHVNAAVDLMNKHHVERLTNGACTVIAGVVFNEIISAFQKVAEYAFSIMKTKRELT
jgi:phosphate:Na+ symporter